jgi:hypothetical protein
MQHIVIVMDGTVIDSIHIGTIAAFKALAVRAERVGRRVKAEADVGYVEVDASGFTRALNEAGHQLWVQAGTDEYSVYEYDVDETKGDSLLVDVNENGGLDLVDIIDTQASNGFKVYLGKADRWDWNTDFRAAIVGTWFPETDSDSSFYRHIIRWDH